MAHHVGIRRGHVYALIDPRTGETRYIGQTLRPQSRLHRHISDAMHGSRSHCGFWVASLLDSGWEPLMVVLEEGDWTAKQLNDAERQWIQRYDNLTNMTRGGEGGGIKGFRHGNHDRSAVWTEEKRKRHGEILSEARARIWWTSRKGDRVRSSVR